MSCYKDSKQSNRLKPSLLLKLELEVEKIETRLFIECRITEKKYNQKGWFLIMP